MTRFDQASNVASEEHILFDWINSLKFDIERAEGPQLSNFERGSLDLLLTKYYLHK